MRTATWVRSAENRDGTLEIDGREQLQAPASLDCGNSGSTMRMLSGILAGQNMSCDLHGDESLTRRPMGRIITPLRLMGAEIRAAAGDRPPLHIHGGRLRAIDYMTPVASAQVKSALLFAGLFAEGETTVDEPHRTRDPHRTGVAGLWRGTFAQPQSCNGARRAEG